MFYLTPNWAQPILEKPHLKSVQLRDGIHNFFLVYSFFFYILRCIYIFFLNFVELLKLVQERNMLCIQHKDYSFVFGIFLAHFLQCTCEGHFFVP